MEELRDVHASSVVHVTIESAGNRVDVEVPTEWTVAQLLPELLRLVYGPEGGRQAAQVPWGIGEPGSRPFAPDATLSQHQVLDGAVLALEQMATWDQPSPRLPARTGAALEDGLSPRQRTLAILPTRASGFERLGSALGALLKAPPAPAGGPSGELAPGVPVAPGTLSVRHKPGALERLRTSWRGSEFEHRLDAAIQGPQLRRCVTIAVMSPKGGVGKTTITALLGSLFALLRRDRIVAVDTNPDFGSLGRTLAPGHHVFVDDLLSVLDSPELTVTALDANLGRSAHGLMVLPAPTDPARMARLDQTAYMRVVRRLQDMVGAVLLDCGTGLHEPATLAALRTADQVILITDAEPATASLVAEAAALLKQEAVPIWLLVNKMPDSGARLDLTALEGYVPHARGLVVVPSDARGADRVAAGLFDWRDAPASWQLSLRQTAAVLAAAWSGLGATT